MGGGLSPVPATLSSLACGIQSWLCVTWHGDKKVCACLWSLTQVRDSQGAEEGLRREREAALGCHIGLCNHIPIAAEWVRSDVKT